MSPRPERPADQEYYERDRVELFSQGDLFRDVPLAYPLYATVGCGLVWLAHADNIERLLHGTERKFDLGLLGRDDPAAGSSG